VAVGSNASPAQLHEKFRHGAVNGVVPVVRATAKDISIAAAAHLSWYGAIPFAPYHSPGRDTDVFVCFFDPTQLALIDKTEKNYDRISGDSYGGSIILHDTKEILYSFFLYRFPVGISAISKPLFTSTLSPTQEVLWNHHRERLPTLGCFLPVRPSYSPAESASFTNTLLSQGFVHSDGLELPSSPQILTESGAEYGRGRSSFDEVSAADAADGIRVVSATGGPLDRRGEHVAVTSVADERKFAKGGYVSVAFPIDGHEMRIVARCVSDANRSSTDVDVALDQVIRDALGVQIKEHVQLAQVDRNEPFLARYGAKLFGPHRYLVMRSQVADLMSAEMGICLVSRTALNILGVSDGERIVIEGSPGTVGPVGRLVLKAHEVPEIVMDRRHELEGGSRESRYPSSRDALAVYPDLPWIFLDADARQRLGIEDEPLSAVRVRADRRFQVVKEIREFYLVFAVAAIALIAALRGAEIRWILFAIVVVVALLALVTRLRNRFS
jgi:hypothetical protein